MRRVEVFALGGATDADVDCAIDLVKTFAGRDGEGNWRSQSANMSWFDKGVSACAYDWRGDSREELARAHEMDRPERMR